MNIRADRKIFIIAGIVVVLCLCLVMAGVVRSLKADNAVLKAKKKELAVLKDETVALKGRVDASEARKSLTKVEGVVQAIDEIVKSLGVSQKVKSVKSLGIRDRQYAIEEEAEVQFEKLSMNEMVNIFFRIENAPMVLAVKKTTVKTSFDNPSLLNISCIISLVKAQGGPQAGLRAESQAGAEKGHQVAPPQAGSQIGTQTQQVESQAESRVPQARSKNKRRARSSED